MAKVKGASGSPTVKKSAVPGKFASERIVKSSPKSTFKQAMPHRPRGK